MNTVRRTSMAMAVMVSLSAWGMTPRAQAEDGAILTGKVVFKGTPPPPQPINFGAEQQCALHDGTSPTTEDVVVNSNGTLRDVLVYVTGQVPGTFTPPTKPAIFDQKGCIFKPHVGAVMVGQPVVVVNNDSVLHNVRAQSKLAQSFNIAQPVQGMKTTKTMKTQEIGIPLKCDVHFWMTAYLHVLAHPYFAVTSDDGTFSIAGLPAGTYTLEAWHGKLGTQQVTVTVQANETKTAELTFASP